MDEKDKEIQDLRRKIAYLSEENHRLNKLVDELINLTSMGIKTTVESVDNMAKLMERITDEFSRKV